MENEELIEELKETIKKLEEEKEQLEYDLELSEEEKDDIQSELDDALDRIEELEAGLGVYDANAIYDIEQFINYMKDEKLYTPEFEKFLAYYLTCHNERDTTQW